MQGNNWNILHLNKWTMHIELHTSNVCQWEYTGMTNVFSFFASLVNVNLILKTMNSQDLHHMYNSN
jgi:hypothetical protein